ncbi:MAG: alanyl-tRNA editing protein [Candidatus Micrarchaeota archaeon]
MTKLLCLKDSYLQECTARAVEVNENEVIFDKTIFYPTGGGVPCDTGTIASNEKTINVIEVRKKEGKIIHVTNGSLNINDECTLKINWARRYACIKMHTAAHVLGATMFAHNALITGNQIGETETRFDFSLEEFDREKINEIVRDANEKLASKAKVRVYELPREEAFKIPGIVKLAERLPPSIAVLRIVEIGSFDTQADGGCHVHNTSECGEIEITRLENKGAKNKRIYFKLNALKD